MTIAEAMRSAAIADDGPHLALLQAAQAGLINLCVLSARDQKLPLNLHRHDRPELMLICDDDDKATGPAGWASAAHATRWARRVITHGAGATVDQYRGFAVAAMAFGRLLLVETDSRHLDAWNLLAGSKLGLTIVPSGGVR